MQSDTGDDNLYAANGCEKHHDYEIRYAVY